VKKSIFQTHPAQTTINELQLRELTEFLLRYRSVINITDTRSIFNTRSLLDTSISRVYERFISMNKDKLFAFIKIPLETNAPEVATYSHVTFDLKQLKPVNEKLYNAVSLVPEYYNKIILNLTTFLKKNNELNNVTTFQSLLVRDLLSRSFYMSNDAWVSPSTLQYLCKTYSMSIAVAISSAYGLSFFEEQSISAIFGFYFLQQITTPELAEAILRNSARYLGLSNTELDSVFQRIKETLQERYRTMSFDDACHCVTQLGISRLEMINRRFLLTRLRSLGPDINTTAISLEYPPYWLWLILLAGSGQKIGLSFNLKRANLDKDINKITEDLLKNQMLLNLMV
jgi:hypothetical protein